MIAVWWRVVTNGRHGFTLVEALAALAIAAVILVATGGLMRNVAGSFDRGTRGVGEAELLLLATDRLASDFGSARYALQKSGDKYAVAFAGEPTKVAFVGAAGIGVDPQREELVTLTIESIDEMTRLVRRRAVWLEPGGHIEDLTPADPVVLIEGRLVMAFTFGRLSPDGTLSWSESWGGEPVLPHFVRLTLRSLSTGDDLLSGGEFVVRSDAPPACAQDDASTGCLAGVAAPPQAGAADAPPKKQ
jgi:prepilin-type N-terminal cleavage/methylation domain-containing protein